MDPCAALTLHIVRLSQGTLLPRTAMVAWCMLPAGLRTTWDETHALLAAAPKPVVVAPLVESGFMTIWSLRDLGDAERARYEREFASQQAYFAEKLQHLGLRDTDTITLELAIGEHRLRVLELRRWAAEYALPCTGVGLIRGPEARTGRLTIRPPGGGRPLGWVDAGDCC
jgi:hypothetical protein